jgi:hypothetical protein
MPGWGSRERPRLLSSSSLLFSFLKEKRRAVPQAEICSWIFLSAHLRGVSSVISAVCGPNELSSLLRFPAPLFHSMGCYGEL